MTLKNGKILIQASFNYKDRIKELSYRRWNPDNKVWESSVSILDEIYDKFPSAEYDLKLKEMIEKIKVMKFKSDKLTPTRKFDLGSFGNGMKLLDYQLAGLEFLEDLNGNALLAYSMGTGKTAIALSYLQLHQELRPAIVVSPKSVTIGWKDEAEKWLDTDDYTTIIDKNKKKYKPADINIINYNILDKFLPELQALKAKVIIFDESHMIKNEKTIRTKAATKLAKKIDHKIELTGTPIMNRPGELYSQLRIIAPETYPVSARWAFFMKYCDPVETAFGVQFKGASNLDALSKELSNIMKICRKEDVLPQLPEKRFANLYFELSNTREYFTKLNKFKAEMETADYSNVEQRKFMLAEMIQLKQLTMRGKIKGVIEYVQENFIENSEKVVLFTSFHETVDILKEAFKDCAVAIDGRSDLDDRAKAISKFQNDKDTLVFIGNIQASGVGITLTAASNVIFIEYPYTPAEYDQAYARCDRLGQKNSVTIYNTIGINSVDLISLNIIEEKRKVINEVMKVKKDYEIDGLKQYLKTVADAAC